MKKPGLKKIARYDDENKSAIVPLLRYLVIHSFLCVGAIALSYFAILNFVAHTILCALICMAAIWNGSKRYYEMMTRFYI